MAYCASCGAILADGTTFCPNCPTPQTQAAAIPGIQANLAGALAYIAGLITGVLFLVLDPYKGDRFVRFHAFQSIFFNVAWIGLCIAWTILGLILAAATKGLFFLIQLPINLALMVGGFALWVFLMYAAYQGRTWRLPYIGDLAAKQAGL